MTSRTVNPTRLRRLRGWLGTRGRTLFALLVAAIALTLIVVGIAQIFLPAGLIATGVSLFAGLFFDPAAVRKLTWPR
jgi:hypothetical protein